jgi:DHA1 family inner membrane transport protein
VPAWCNPLVSASKSSTRARPCSALWVLQRAGGAGQSLASSLDIGAFNLGNALGAWLGGLVIERGPGLAALAWSATLVVLSGLIVALWCVRLERNRRGDACGDPTFAAS